MCTKHNERTHFLLHNNDDKLNVYIAQNIKLVKRQYDYFASTNLSQWEL